jgi:hypothetical protein
MGHGLMASGDRKAFLKTKKREKCFDFFFEEESGSCFRTAFP